MLDKVRKVPYWVYDGLSLLSAIITIVTAVGGFFKVHAEIETLKDGTIQVSYDFYMIFVCLILGLALVVVCIKLRKYAAILRRQRQSVAFNYYHFLHDLRNVYFDILKRHKKGSEVKISQRIEFLTKETATFLQSALDYLCNILETLTGESIHACIKVIENQSNTDYQIDINNATVKTFCRSTNTPTNRVSKDKASGDSIRIKSNTDFYELLTNPQMSSYFYQTNLLEYDAWLRKTGKSYRNSTENWQKYYLSTIVAPIRIANERVHYIEGKEGYNVIGFLCVDTLSTNAFRNNDYDKENYSNIVKSFAAEMYIILSKYSYYLSKLERPDK